MRLSANIFVPAISLIAAGASSAAPQPAPDPELASATQAITQAAKDVTGASSGSDGFALDDARDAPALAGQWSAIRHFVAVLLDRRPELSEAALRQEGKRAGNIALNLVRLDRDSVLIGVEAEAFGDAFVLRRGADGHFAPALALDESGPWVVGASALAAWRPDRAAAECRDSKDPAGWQRCGPMTFHNATALPPEADGSRRFAIVGRYVKPAGATDAYQLSIWRWNGHGAAPLLVRTFEQVADQPILARSGPHDLTIRVKASHKSFIACGSCAGRQMEWRFALPARGVLAPVERSLTPDLDLVDALYDRLLHARPAADLAAPAVIAALAPSVRALLQDADEKGDASLGLLDGWKASRSAKGAVMLCVAADALERPLSFTIIARNGRKWISAVRLHPGKTCGNGAS